MADISTVTVNGKTHNIKDMVAREALDTKLENNLGEENVGKFLVINDNGNIVPMEILNANGVSF